MQVVQKPWGQEVIIEVTEKYAFKKITVFQGHRTSLQFHKDKLETIQFLTDGGRIDIDGKRLEIKAGDVYTIAPLHEHRVDGTYSNVVYYEVSTPELDDVVRVEDDYGRE